MSDTPSRGSNLLVWLFGLFAVGGATLVALPRVGDPPGKPPAGAAKDAKGDERAASERGYDPLRVVTDEFRVDAPDAARAAGSRLSLNLEREGSSFALSINEKGEADKRGARLAEHMSRVHAGNTYEYEFLIATVPDPVGSKFPHEFDAVVEGIQRAFEARSFVLRASQLPWPHAAARDGGDAKAARSPPDQPGVLLFRHSRDPKRTDQTAAKEVVYRYAVVCLVGESPISGIHKPVLTAALKAREDLAAAVAKAHALQPPPAPGKTPTRIKWEGGATEVQLVAPFFTGSQWSLIHTLERWKEREKKGGREVKFQIVNGSATGLRPVGFSDRGVEEPRSTVIPGELLTRGVLRYLAGSRDTNLSDDPVAPLPPLRHRVAILREANTGFGALTWTSQDSAGTGGVGLPLSEPPLDLPFPLSISQLPALLEKNGKPGVELPRTDFVEPRLPVRDRTRFDAVPAYDPESAASTAGQSLRTIMTTIARARIRYVGIVASDTRDVVFLNSLLQKECPHVRVFTTEPGVALLHPEEAIQLRGMVVGSTYPLAPSAQVWARTPHSPRRMIPFPTQGSQGYYNAVLAHSRRHDLMFGYRPPNIPGDHDLDRPPIWISVIGHGGRLVPVHCYTKYPDSDDRSTVLRATVTDEVRAAHPTESVEELRPRGLRPVGVPGGVLLGSLAAACAVGAVVLALAVPGVWRKVASGVTDGERKTHHIGDTAWVWVWRGVILAGVLLFALPYALPARDLFADWFGESSWRHWTVLALAVLIAAEVVAAAVGFVLRGFGHLLPVTDESAAERRERLTGAAACLVLALLLAAAGVGTALWWANQSPVERFFLYVRATDLTAGMSPVVPMGLLGATAVALGWCCLQQADLARRARLRCPYPAVWSRLTDADKELNADLGNHLRFVGSGRNLAITLGLGVPFLLSFVWNGLVVPLPSEEGTTWDVLMRGVFWLAAGGVVFALARFLALWTRLARLLEEVLRVPMVGAFERLPHAIGQMFGGYLYSQRPRHRQLAAVAWALPADAREELAVRIARERPGLAWVFGSPAAPVQSGDSDQEDRKWLAEQLQKKADTYLLELPSEWRHRPVDEAFGAARHGEERPSEQPSAKTESGAQVSVSINVTPCKDEKPSAKEEYVAVFVVMYLGGYFAQLRMLAYAIALTAPLLLFATASYPFQPDRPRLTALLGLLTAVALGTVYVLYKINKDGLISRIARTTPNRFTPDSGFLSSVATYVLPLAALVLLQVLGLFRFIIEPVLSVFE